MKISKKIVTTIIMAVLVAAVSFRLSGLQYISGKFGMESYQYVFCNVVAYLVMGVTVMTMMSANGAAFIGKMEKSYCLVYMVCFTMLAMGAGIWKSERLVSLSWNLLFVGMVVIFVAFMVEMATNLVFGFGFDDLMEKWLKENKGE